jgi:hypothetical protein
MTQQSQPKGSGKQDRLITYYDVLDLDRDADPEEIKAAYHDLARKYHPDVASDDPAAAQRFTLINEAYKVLSDQQRRHQYDRTLPRKSYPLRHLTPEKIWREATDVVLIRSDRFGPLNQAMQAAIPIVLDESILVITMPGSERHLAGHLETASNRNSILNAMELVAGRRLSFRIIDGTTVQDWELLKAAERRRTAPRTPTASARTSAPTAPGAGLWDEIIQQMHRQFQQLTRRQQPQARARFFRETLAQIIRAEEDMRDQGGEDEEGHERAFARVLERLATILEVPAVIVALEFDRMKRTGDY